MTHSRTALIGQLVLRVGIGSVLVAHGTQKLFGWFGGAGLEATGRGFESMGLRPGRAWAASAGLGEAGGGAALALGLATPLAGAAAASTMGVAASRHVPNGFFNGKGGLEFPATLGLAAASFALGGPGPLSVDQLLRNVVNRPWMRVVGIAAIAPSIATIVFLQRRGKARLEAAAAVASAESSSSGVPASDPVADS